MTESSGTVSVELLNSERRVSDSLRAENDKLRAALDLFVNFCTYRVAREINPRGYAWRAWGDLDYARGEALKVLGGAAEQSPPIDEGTLADELDEVDGNDRESGAGRP